MIGNLKHACRELVQKMKERGLEISTIEKNIEEVCVDKDCIADI